MDDVQSIPLIRLFDNLIVSIQVPLDDMMIDRLIDSVTRTIEETHVSGLILDFSGADVLDSHATRKVRDLAMTVRFMGVETVVCGLRRAVVISLVEMGMSTPGVSTALNLERALETLVRRRRETSCDRLRASSPAGAGAPAPDEPPATHHEGGIEDAVR